MYTQKKLRKDRTHGAWWALTWGRPEFPGWNVVVYSIKAGKRRKLSEHNFPSKTFLWSLFLNFHKLEESGNQRFWICENESHQHTVTGECPRTSEFLGRLVYVIFIQFWQSCISPDEKDQKIFEKRKCQSVVWSLSFSFNVYYFCLPPTCSCIFFVFF